jgi:myo-inositol-1(or 4)-monophosphatase
MTTTPDLVQACEALARGAGRILKEAFSRPRSVERKTGHNDMVTDADKASEAYLIAEVRRRFPGHAILAEESGSVDGHGGDVVWVMDPLDGTTNYAHGFPHFNVSVAAVPAGGGAALAGCVYDPLRDEAFLAGRGMGAWVTSGAVSTTLRVSRCPALQDALLATGFPYDKARHDDNNHAEHRAINVQVHGVRRAGAAALDLAYVAAGRLDGYWEAHLQPWDLAAGALLVLEAGGVVTGYQGQPFDGSQSAVVTAGPGLHAALLSAVNQARVLAGFPVEPRRPGKGTVPPAGR